MLAADITALSQKILRVLDSASSGTFRMEDLNTDVTKWSDEIQRRYAMYKSKMDFQTSSDLARREVVEIMIREALWKELQKYPLEVESAHLALDVLEPAPPTSLGPNRTSLNWRIHWYADHKKPVEPGD